MAALRFASPKVAEQSPAERAWTAFAAAAGPDAGSQDGHVVGYSGYVSGASNFYGMSFARTTAEAHSPTKPTTAPPGVGDSPRKTAASPRSNVPGYGGYLTGRRFKFANT